MNPYPARVDAPARADISRMLLTLSTLLVTLDFLLIRLPVSFSSPDVRSFSVVFGTSGILGIVSGTALGIRAESSLAKLAGLGFLLASLLAQVCPWLYWLAFDGHLPYAPIFAVQPLVAGLVISYLIVRVTSDGLRRSGPNALLQRATSLGSLPIASVFFLVLACSQSFVGLLLYGSLTGTVLLIVSMRHAFARGLEQPRFVSLWAPRALSLLVVVVTAASFRLALRVLPLKVVHASLHRVVHYSKGKTRDLRITSGQDAFHVFEGNRLRFTTLDQHRWGEALTQPALARLHCPKKALVFSQGEGLAERELLKCSCIQSITSVVRDRIAVDAGKRQAWWRNVIADAWNSPRVRVTERDPAVWLMDSATDKFDIAIIDLPDPENFVDAKYYTRFFYKRLAQRLTEESVIITQATSALRTPRTFASIRATLDAAGFATQPFHTELTTLGDWYFVLATPTLRSKELSPDPAGAVYSFSIPPDASPKLVGKVSRLEDPATLDTFLEETGAEPLLADDGP